MSNGKRAKQFLKLFTAPDGSRESMMQRMMRQMQTAGLTGDVTVVTSDDQRDIIAAQFGQNVDLVIEPSRRGTYPALALAAARLAIERQLPDDEVVVAMPCDVYAETAYFATINAIAAAVKNGEATLAMIDSHLPHHQANTAILLQQKMKIKTADCAVYCASSKSRGRNKLRSWSTRAQDGTQACLHFAWAISKIISASAWT